MIEEPRRQTIMKDYGMSSSPKIKFHVFRFLTYLFKIIKCIFLVRIFVRPKLEAEALERIREFKIGGKEKSENREENEVKVDEEKAEKDSSPGGWQSPDDESGRSSMMDITREDTREDTLLSTTCDEDQENSANTSDDNRDGPDNFLPPPTQNKFGNLLKMRTNKSTPTKVPVPAAEEKSLSSVIGIPTALRAVGKVKMGESARKADRDTDSSAHSTSSRRSGTSIAAAFKSKAGLFGGKKKKADREPKKEVKTKKLKNRIFFINKRVETDAEVIDNIGKLDFAKEVSQGFDTIAKTASLIQKLCKEKENGRKASIHEGNVKEKLKLLEISPDSYKNISAIILDSTKFLGKVTLKLIIR